MRSHQDPSEGRRHTLQHLNCTEDTTSSTSEGGTGAPTHGGEWCHRAPMVPVMKKGGGVRICVDLKKLNRAVKRERDTCSRPSKTSCTNSKVPQSSRSWTRRRASGNSRWMTRRQSWPHSWHRLAGTSFAACPSESHWLPKCSREQWRTFSVT